MPISSSARRFHSANPVRFPAIIAAALLFAVPARAAPLLPDLGVAGKFNAFILENMKAYHSDVEGRLAVGGNLTLEHYSIGLQLPNSRGSRNDLVVGGITSIQHGRLYSGNAVIGGDNNIHQQNVGFYNGDDPADASGEVLSGSPLDFAALGAELRAKSSQWGAWGATGTTAVSDYGEVRFMGSGRESIFSVDAGALNSASSLWFDMPRYTTAVINVVGTSVELGNVGFFHTAIPGEHKQMPDNRPREFRHSGSLTNRVLFNFVDATEITMHGIGFKGSLLAPLANVSFYNGHIDGNFISRSLTAPDLSGLDEAPAGQASGQFNYYAFNQVPTPSTLASLLVGFLMLRVRGRRRQAGRRRENSGIVA